VAAVEAETEPANAASQAVLRKVGFVPTGTVGKEGPRFILRTLPA
jgi:ribosomal-protein-alanine N-acetyltransferase